MFVPNQPFANPPFAAASQPPSPDIQQLVGLLGSLMPLLLRFQAQGYPSQGFQPQGFPPQGFQPQGLQPQGLQPQGLQPQPFPQQPFQPTFGQPLQGNVGMPPLGGAGATVPPLGGAGNTVPNPALDHQAAEALVSDMTAGSLRTLSAYLEVHAAQHAGLETCIAIVTQAAQRFAARDYADAFNLVWLAYRAIETIRASDPQLPPVRGSGDATSSSIH